MYALIKKAVNYDLSAKWKKGGKYRERGRKGGRRYSDWY